jgi:conjugative transfer region lipoprotein (TIGR03751 family)
MFVFPHLAGEAGVPVPGYATTFPMYERAEYALPGEVPSEAQ